MPTASPPRPAEVSTDRTATDRSSDEADHRALARVAADRARSLRRQAAGIAADGLEPLRSALRIRAAELELAAAALGDEPDPLPHRTT